MLTNWINKINTKKQYYNREKLKKGSKHQRHERDTNICQQYWIWELRQNLLKMARLIIILGWG